MRHVARGWLGRHPNLQRFPVRVPAETVQQRLLELLEVLENPELFLVLEKRGDSGVEWRCFRTVTVFHGTIEEGVGNKSLASASS